MAASQFVAGVKAASASGTWHAPQVAAMNYAWPYAANVVWQDTSSNATYCSAVSALSH